MAIEEFKLVYEHTIRVRRIDAGREMIGNRGARDQGLATEPLSTRL